MIRFTLVKLLGGKVFVNGPMGGLGGELKHVSFVLNQDGVTVEGRGQASGDNWWGEAPAQSLHPGPVFAVGVAVAMEDLHGPPSVRTTTWCETATIVT
jgi:hypothetical protein